MDFLLFLLAVLLVIIFWPLIKAFALVFLVALVVYLLVKPRR